MRMDMDKGLRIRMKFNRYLHKVGSMPDESQLVTLLDAISLGDETTEVYLCSGDE